MPKDKSVGAALVLTFFFGPLGLFYCVAWWAALLMFFGAVVIGVITLGIGAAAFWAASMIWAAIAASKTHGEFQTWLARQPQTVVAQSSTVGPSLAPAPATGPPLVSPPWSQGS